MNPKTRFWPCARTRPGTLFSCLVRVFGRHALCLALERGSSAVVLTTLWIRQNRDGRPIGAQSSHPRLAAFSMFPEATYRLAGEILDSVIHLCVLQTMVPSLFSSIGSSPSGGRCVAFAADSADRAGPSRAYNLNVRRVDWPQESHRSLADANECVCCPLWRFRGDFDTCHFSAPTKMSSWPNFSAFPCTKASLVNPNRKAPWGMGRL